MKRTPISVCASVVLGVCLSPLVVAQSVEEGTWTGTRIGLGGRNQRSQRVSLEIKKGPDPHTAWRPEGKQVVNAILVLPGNKLQASDLRIEPTGVSFSYRLETLVTCRLGKQSDGTYQGDCLGEGAGRNFRMTLNPPKASS